MINHLAPPSSSPSIVAPRVLSPSQVNAARPPEVSDQYDARPAGQTPNIRRPAPQAKASVAASLALRGALVAGIATVSFAGASGCIINTGPREQVCNDTPKAEAPKTDDTQAEAAKPEEPNGFLVGATILSGGWLFLTLGAAALTFGRGNI